jgi:hypothetical protein
MPACERGSERRRIHRHRRRRDPGLHEGVTSVARDPYGVRSIQ